MLRESCGEGRGEGSGVVGEVGRCQAFTNKIGEHPYPPTYNSSPTVSTKPSHSGALAGCCQQEIPRQKCKGK